MRPIDVGLPPKFETWRKGQDDALRALLFSDHRFDALVIPVGGGKTAIYMGYVLTDQRRAAIVTATRVLEDQLAEEFEDSGLLDIRGKGNYTCDIEPAATAAEAVCNTGTWCERKEGGGCEYYDLRREAGETRLVQTNYAYWLHAWATGALGQFHTLVLDEAHAASEEIARFAAVELTGQRVGDWGLQPPPENGAVDTWGPKTIDALMAKMREAPPKTRGAMYRFAQAVGRLCRLSAQEWVFSKTGGGRWVTWRWDLVDPGVLAESLLFRGAGHVILSSASVNRKTLRMLGIVDKVKVREQESTFPVGRRPIYYWPVTRVGRKMGQEGEGRLVDAVDEWVEARLDRKGLILTASYELGTWIHRNSRLGSRGVFLLHRRGEDTSEVVKRFRKAPAPACLISPAVATGLNFPYTDAEYVLIPKVPFPDMSNALVRARMQHDRQYASYVAMQHLVQASGRAMRARDDQCEIGILDGNFGWLRGRNWELAPRYFHAAVKTLDGDGPGPRPIKRLG